jgi:hypothetical protein
VFNALTLAHMIIDHCLNVVVTGQSPHDPNEYTSNDRVFDTLKTGLRIRRLNGLKSGLLMIELIRSEQANVDAQDIAHYFDNFIHWSLETLPVEMTLALVAYAIRDRNLQFKKYLKDCEGYKYLVEHYGDIILADDEEAAKSPVWRKMKKYQAVLSRSVKRVKEAVDNADDEARISRVSEADHVQAA